jgi:thioredoxin reductase
MIVMSTDGMPQISPPAPLARVQADIGIVGSGPAGLFAAYYAGLRELSVAMLDSLEAPGGQVAALYPDKSIYDVAAHPEVSGRELVDALLAQVEPMPVQMLHGHTVTGMRPLAHGAGGAPAGWRLVTDHRTAVDCRVAVLSAGAGSSTARRLACAERHVDRGVAYTSVAPERGSGRDVVVVGGGDSAVDCALGLVATARSVTLVHRSERFKAHEREVSQLRAAPVDVLTSTEVVACHGEPLLEAVTLRDRRAGAEHRWPASLLVVSLGMVTRPGPLGEWGLEMDGTKVLVGSDMQTSLPGVFAVGDVATYPGKVPLIVTGFGEAATAINNAAVLVRPGEDVDPGHSTDRLHVPTICHSTGGSP